MNGDFEADDDLSDIDIRLSKEEEEEGRNKTSQKCSSMRQIIELKENKDNQNEARHPTKS
jgi:hypothetical protein